LTEEYEQYNMCLEENIHHTRYSK